MKQKRLGIIIGSILAVVAAASIFLIDRTPEEEEKPLPVRPINSMVVGEAGEIFERSYPGRVDAVDSFLLSFEVGGNLIELIKRKGDRVKEGAVLAKLNPSDFESKRDAAQAQLTRARADFERNRKLFATGNAAAADVESSQAVFEVATSDLERAQKALNDTSLTASFDGIIADRYPEQFENVAAGQAIYRLQSEDSGLKIEIEVPERHVARFGRANFDGKAEAVASFDFLPGREFPLEKDEFASIADPATQTFKLSFRLTEVEGARILPGMSSTVTARIKQDPAAGVTGLYAPLNAVPPDGSGAFFVWKLEDQGNGRFAATRNNVTVGDMQGDEILITDGLAMGDRIATAGVRVLQEGQIVRLLEELEQ